MCTLTRENPKLQIATEDIEVYKVIRIEHKKFLFFYNRTYYKSIICNFTYKKNKIYETKLDPFREYVDSSAKPIFKSGQGFYSYKNKIDVLWAPSLAKFIIPKGSKYYLVKDINGNWIYTSNKIRFVS